MTPFSTPTKRIPRCIFDVNLVILSQIQIIARTSHISKNSEPKWPWKSRSMVFLIPAEIIPGCIFGAYLVIQAQICDELSNGEAEFPRIMSQNGQNYLECQGQWPPFSIPVESIPGCMFDANLLIPAQICDELLCWKSKVYGRMDKCDEHYPFGLKGQGVKMTLWMPNTVEPP